MDTITFNKLKIIVNDINANNKIISEANQNLMEAVVDLSSLLLSVDPATRSQLRMNIKQDILTIHFEPGCLDNI